MQVNPIGVQTYQQFNRQENVADKTDDAAVAKAEAKNVTIKPQDEMAPSRLAVKAPRGSYADNLTEAETRALDLLFSRFNEAGRFGPGYADDEAAEKAVGNVIDLKV
jgi:hypothetical protein